MFNKRERTSCVHSFCQLAGSKKAWATADNHPLAITGSHQGDLSLWQGDLPLAGRPTKDWKEMFSEAGVAGCVHPQKGL
jgi:hypothetical protein